MKNISTILSYALFFAVISILASCQGCSQSGRKLEAQKRAEASGAQAATPDSSTQKGFDLEGMLDASASFAGVVRIWNYAERPTPLLPLSKYENLTEEETKSYVNDLVRIAEKQAVYVADNNGADASKMSLKLCVLNTEGGHYLIEICKSKGFIENLIISKMDFGTSSTPGLIVNSYWVAFDGGGNGFLDPQVGHDKAVWPNIVQSSAQFYDQTPEQHRYANTKYVQLVSYLTRIIQCHEDHYKPAL